MERDELHKIPLPGLSNYRIIRDGRIYSFHSKKFIKDRICNGYKSFTQTLEKTDQVVKTRSYAIHRLLALVFIPNPHEYKTVTHINKNKLDNRVENLEWTTHKKTVQNCKKTTSHSRKVHQICEDGLCIEYDSITEAANELGLSRSAISKACLKINKTSGGCEWKFVDSSHNHTKVDLSDGIEINNSPGYYVFKDGKIYNTSRKSFLKPVKNLSGYCYITLCQNSKKKNHYIHRLVAEHFISKPTNTVVVNHKNSVRHDNRAQNLEWVSKSENNKHMYAQQAFGTKPLEKSAGGPS